MWASLVIHDTAVRGQSTDGTEDRVRSTDGTKDGGAPLVTRSCLVAGRAEYLSGHCWRDGRVTERKTGIEAAAGGICVCLCVREWGLMLSMQHNEQGTGH